MITLSVVDFIKKCEESKFTRYSFDTCNQLVSSGCMRSVSCYHSTAYSLNPDTLTLTGNDCFIVFKDVEKIVQENKPAELGAVFDIFCRCSDKGVTQYRLLCDYVSIAG